MVNLKKVFLIIGLLQAEISCSDQGSINLEHIAAQVTVGMGELALTGLKELATRPFTRAINYLSDENHRAPYVWKSLFPTAVKTGVMLGGTHIVLGTVSSTYLGSCTSLKMLTAGVGLTLYVSGNSYTQYLRDTRLQRVEGKIDASVNKLNTIITEVTQLREKLDNVITVGGELRREVSGLNTCLNQFIKDQNTHNTTISEQVAGIFSTLQSTNKELQQLQTCMTRIESKLDTNQRDVLTAIAARSPNAAPAMAYPMRVMSPSRVTRSYCTNTTDSGMISSRNSHSEIGD